MARSTAPLFSIGEFSRLTLISVRMLRHYDEHGVLAPADVDPYNGYRRYAPEQLRIADRIRFLRDAGFGVDEIAELLPQYDDPAALREALMAQQSRLRAEADAALRRVDRVDQLITHLKESVMSIEIEHTTLPAMPVASLRGVIPTFADEGQLWGRLMGSLDGAVGFPPEALMGATFHDEEYRERDCDVEVWAQVDAPFADRGEATCVQRPATEVVAGLLRGSYDQMGAAMTELGEWIGAHNLTIAGPMFNIYLVGPNADPNPANWLTRVCIPVRAA